MNREVIAIDQDPLGKQASPVKNGDLETWVKPLADGGVAVGVVNLGAAAAEVTVKASDLGLNGEGEEGAGRLGAYGSEVQGRGVLGDGAFAWGVDAEGEREVERAGRAR